MWSPSGALPMSVGLWYQPPASAVLTMGLTLGQLRITPISIGRDCVLDGIAFEITTGGGAGSFVRVGLYLINPVTMVSSLLLDAGQQDASVAAIKTITGLAVPITAGSVIGLCVCGQGVASTVRAVGGGNALIGVATVGTLISNMIDGWSSTASTFTGALPGSLPALGISTSAPRLLLRASS